MITQINEFKIHMINEASYDQLQNDMVDSGKIDQKIFDDVKANINKSAYGTWILKMIIDKIILPEDVYKYKEYFDIFDRNKKQYDKKDIFQYKSKDDLSNFLSKTLEIKDKESKDSSSIKGVSKNDKYKQFEIGEVSGFTVYELPKGNKKLYQVSCDLGSGTEWCTATGKTKKYFNQYITEDSLFIFIKGNEKYQFHYKDQQFMDKNDEDILHNNDLNSEKYIYDFFKFIQNKYNEYEIPNIIKIMFNGFDNIDMDSLTKTDWTYISKYVKLSEDFMREYYDRLNWGNISMYQILSNDFMREFNNKLYWYTISTYQRLSEDFMREFKHKVEWSRISFFQTLSEDFIREFQNELEWYHISMYQVLSYEFIIEFKDKLTERLLLKNEKLSDELKDKIKELYTI